MSLKGLLEGDGFVQAVLDAMPLPIFVVDNDVRIFAVNQAASLLLGTESTVIFRRRAGEALQCVHSKEASEGCGRGTSCNDCIVRNSVTATFRDHGIRRQKTRMELTEEGKGAKEIYLLVTTAPVEYNEHELVLLTLQDISELMELKRILPICAHCKKIRDDDRYWHSVEKYFKEHMDQDFSHGLCPDCAKKFYPGYFNGAKPPPSPPDSSG